MTGLTSARSPRRISESRTCDRQCEADDGLRRFTASNLYLLSFDDPAGVVLQRSTDRLGKSPTEDVTGGIPMSVYDAEYFRRHHQAQATPKIPPQATEPRRLEQLPWPRNLFGELA